MTWWMFLLEFPSLLFYIFVLSVIWTSHTPRLQTTFFVFVYVMGIADITAYMCNLCTRGVLFLHPSSFVPPVNTICSLINKSSCGVHLGILILIALNRFTAICTPFAHKRIWKKKYLHLWIIFVILGGVLSYIHIYISVILYGWLNNQWEVEGMARVNVFNRICNFIAVSLPCTISLFLTLFTLRLWPNRRRPDGERVKRSQTHLLVYAGTVVVVTIPLCVYQLIKLHAIFTKNKEMVRALTKWFYLIFYIFNFSAPYILLIVCPSVRHECLRVCHSLLSTAPRKEQEENESKKSKTTGSTTM